MSRHDHPNPRKLYPREASTYRNMKTRCNNPKATGYCFYGGRGITVCARWQESFWNFLADMGERPAGCSIDRKDVYGPYSPENCRWATSKEQGNNTSKHYYLTYDGRTQNLAQWGEELGIKQNTIYYRLSRGWTPPEALEQIERIPPWMGRLTKEQVEYAVEQVDSGRTQIDVGKELHMHSSQISRLYRKTKTLKEKEKR